MPLLTTGAGAYRAIGGGAYVGPGDIQSGAAAWYGLRAYNAAYATALGNCLDLVDQAGANPITIKVKTDGTMDVAAVSAWVTANSVTTIKVTGIYDQSGAGNNLVQATLVNMPKLTLSALGSLPMIEFLAASAQQVTNGTLSVSQPFTASTVAKRLAVVSLDAIFIGSGNSTGVFFSSTTGNLTLFSGTSQQNITATEAAFHAAQSLFNGASSAAYIDGSNTVVGATPGAAGITGAGVGSSTFTATMLFAEAGIWSGDKSANNSAMNSNQHTYWGF